MEEITKHWLEIVFGGIGATIIGIIIQQLLKKKAVETTNTNTNQSENTNTNSVVINNLPPSGTSSNDQAVRVSEDDLTRLKKVSSILFIDDDTKFKVVTILKNSGWGNTKSIKEASSLDIAEIVEANIIFVDIKGVGIKLGFSDEGLGLALELKRKYSDKKIIIYSSDTTNNIFHEALREVDATLWKNATPYQFINLVETFSKEIFS